MGRRTGSALRLVREVALTAAAACGVLCLLAFLALAAFDVRPLVFRSGSMGPTIPTGSLALAQRTPVGEVRIGDVVSVPADGVRVTHRVVAVDGDHLTLQGDANAAPDAEPYEVTRVDRVFWHVPWWGYVVAWTTTRTATFAIGVLAVILVAVIVRPRRRSGDPPQSGPGADSGEGGGEGGAHRAAPRAERTQKAGRRRLLARGLASSLTAVVTVIAGTGPTWAAWTDPGVLRTGSYVGYVVPPPTLSCGALGVLSVTFTWSAVAPVKGATVRYTLTAGGVAYPNLTTTSRQVVSVISGGTANVVATMTFGSTTWTSVSSNTRTYTVAAVSLCS